MVTLSYPETGLDNDWFWYDETPVSTGFDNWGELQPDGHGDCVAANLGLESGFSRWEDVDCSIDAGVFCKAPRGKLRIIKKING